MLKPLQCCSCKSTGGVVRWSHQCHRGQWGLQLLSQGGLHSYPPDHMFSYWSWSLTLVQQSARFHTFIIQRNHTRITRFYSHLTHLTRSPTHSCKNAHSQEQPHLHLSGKHDFQIKRKRANNTKWVMCTFNLNFQGINDIIAAPLGLEITNGDTTHPV